MLFQTLRSWFKPEKKEIIFPKPVLAPEQGNKWIQKRLLSNIPTMVCRVGGVEFSCLVAYLDQKRDQKRFKKGIRDQMRDNAGFFPAKHPELARFCEELLGHLSQADAVCVWHKPQEPAVFSRYCPKATLMTLAPLDAYQFDMPWTAALEGKKVLVIHPFSKTIEKQYAQHRAKIFKNPQILPEFELITLQAVQSVAGNKTAFSSWFEAYQSMTKQIDAIDFDIALIGAGAYGLPLAGYIRKCHKHAIHIGGSTQILFGIKGKRWDADPQVSRLYNPYWTRPSAEETPSHIGRVEGGTYW